jgi:allophanate hydrolase subunit 2
MLGNDEYAESLEIISIPSVEFTRDCFIILAGAPRNDTALFPAGAGSYAPISVKHGVVTEAPAGSRLSLGDAVYGFRTYLCVRPVDGMRAVGLAGLRMPSFAEMAGWPDPEGRIRVLEGPEAGCLTDVSEFLAQPWQATSAMSDMGIQLASPCWTTPGMLKKDMISQPVNDGTIQLAPGGPIVLLRGRQTVGGYPRIFNVISADVDLLAQYAPNQIMRFRKVAVEDAQKTYAHQQRDLQRLR